MKRQEQTANKREIKDPAAGVMEEGGESGQQQRVRAWVDISPEGEEYLRANDFLLMIVCSAVRLRPASSSHPALDRS